MAFKGKARDIVYSFHERSEAALSLRALASLLFEAVDMLGFRYAACGAHFDPQAPPSGAFLWHNYPSAWVERFSAKRYHRLDPISRYARSTREVFSWDDPLFLAGLSERQRRILNEARLHRLAHGHTIPLCHDPYLPASCSFVSETGDIAPGVIALARRIATVIHGRAMLLARTAGQGETMRLTPRERACLALKARGAADSDIALALAISRSTARRHIEQAKHRLSAKSREHAVALAIQTRQIR